MDVDLKIKKILQDYQLNGDGVKTKLRLGGLYGIGVVQNKKNVLKNNDLVKIRSAYLDVKKNRIVSWKNRQRF